MRYPVSPVPLPVCPRPYVAESRWSWLTRVGRTYGYSPSRFLRATGLSCDRGLVPPLRETLALSPASVQQLARIARLPIGSVEPMWSVPPEWVLAVKQNQPLCPKCWLEDLAAGRSIYERGLWRHAWRVLCGRHGIPLESASKVFTARVWYKRRRLDEPVAPQPLRRRLQQQVVFDRRFASQRAAILAALRDVERAFDFAIRGWDPDAEVWQGINAQTFLKLADEVAIWSLNNFEPYRARTVVDNWLSLEECWTGFGLFAWRDRFTRIVIPGQSMIRLVDIVNPAIRRSVLWIIHLMLAKEHPDVRDRKGPPGVRGKRVYMLAHQYPSALHWLLLKMSSWPDVYETTRSDLAIVVSRADERVRQLDAWRREYATRVRHRDGGG